MSAKSKCKRCAYTLEGGTQCKRHVCDKAEIYCWQHRSLSLPSEKKEKQRRETPKREEKKRDETKDKHRMERKEEKEQKIKREKEEKERREKKKKREEKEREERNKDIHRRQRKEEKEQKERKREKENTGTREKKKKKEKKEKKVETTEERERSEEKKVDEECADCGITHTNYLKCRSTCIGVCVPALQDMFGRIRFFRLSLVNGEEPDITNLDILLERMRMRTAKTETTPQQWRVRIFLYLHPDALAKIETYKSYEELPVYQRLINMLPNDFYAQDVNGTLMEVRPDNNIIILTPSFLEKLCHVIWHFGFTSAYVTTNTAADIERIKTISQAYRALRPHGSFRVQVTPPWGWGQETQESVASALRKEGLPVEIADSQ